MTVEPMVFERISGGVVKFDSNPLRTMMTYRQTSSTDPESGGILLGRHIVDSDDMVIDLITIPYRGDVRRRCLFVRRSTRHQREVDYAWKASHGTCTYLGEWHTHPEANPHPSPIDLANWRERLLRDTYEGTSLVFAIIGIADVRLWEANRCPNGSFKTLIRQMIHLPK